MTSAGHDGSWTDKTPGYQNYNISSEQAQFQKPIESSSNYQTFQDTQKTTYPQPNIVYAQPNITYQQPNITYPATPQVNPNYLPSLQTPQTFPAVDSRRVSNLQIPSNPRIVANMVSGLPKTNKESSAATAVAKPAYISVSLPKPGMQVSSHEATDSILKPGMFPKSLRGYVERALARCKDDTQKEACQSVMKEIIIKATADGSITRDWDTEPLFPIPSTDVTNKDLLVSTTISSLSKSKRSPSRRSKSRWEPVLEDKSVDKVASVTPDSANYGLARYNGNDKKVAGGKLENKNFNFSSNKKSSLLDHRITNRSNQKPFKKQRFDDNVDEVDNGEASSDSDKEQSLTAYYSGAIALADSPEEKKKREHRSKRFEKGPGRRTENYHYKPKSVGSGSLYSRRATAMVLSKNFEEISDKAVEDIDWDALTVKGTSQEIEKRYLRLTSAPDPSTVRPEEVLEKALLMVQNSQKNYLYKCDQLKSIRQDLTVQRIRNELTVKVYETHARFAIEAGDLAECNQCQSQLKTLYAEGIKGCHMEFSAYDLLRVISHSSNNRDLLSAMSRLSIETKRDEAVKHALAVRAAVTSGNYVLFFRLYKTAPNLNTCLMDLYVEKMRYSAVKCMSRSYRPTVPVSYIAQLLGFTSSMPTTEMAGAKDSEGLEDCAEWLKAHGASLIVDNSTGEMQLDSKASSSTLYMPDPEDAVAHGDTTLAVNDFLAKNIS